MPIGFNSLCNLARIRPFRSRRASSFDRTGGNRDACPVKPGRRITLAEIDGPGCIKHIWSTNALAHDRDAMRSTILRIWWDGEPTPSVEVPLADFFGGGFGICRDFASLPLQMNPDSGRAMNCWFPMPFRLHARFEIHNEWHEKNNIFFYIDYEQYTPSGQLIQPRPDRKGGRSGNGARSRLPFPHGRGADLLHGRGSDDWDEAGAELAYFHAQWRRENPTRGWGRKDLKGPKNLENLKSYWKTPNTTGDDNYVILEAVGRGQYVGCHLDIDCFAREKNDWYGEGDDMIFIDGEPWPPSLHGTGTEDYFCGAYCPRDVFNTPYAGITQYSGSPQWGEHDWPFRGKNSMYRFHVEDPIRFDKSIRVTIEHGHNNKLSNDYSSTAYWYQFEPHSRFPTLPPARNRLARPDWPAFVPGTDTPATPAKQPSVRRGTHGRPVRSK